MITVPIIALYNPQDQTILLSIRPEGKQLAGYYEFPGGKLEWGETPAEALSREVFEELDLSLDPNELKPVSFTEFRFEEKEYLLLLYFCVHPTQTPIGKEGQKLHYADIAMLETYKMPAANRVLIGALKQYISLVYETI